MKHFKTVFIALAFVGLLLPSCAEKKTSEPAKPVVDAPMPGSDADEQGCKGSAGYQWSSLQKMCIRSFELPIQLLSADKTTGAGVVMAADHKQAEVFSAMGTVVLAAQTEMLFTGNSGGTDWYLEKKGGKWNFGKKGETAPAYMEQ